MIYACTNCGREKSTLTGSIPAKERYVSERVKKVIELSNQKRLPLLFISGKYGLISADTKIPYYNHRLEESSVSTLIILAIKQAKDLKISKLIFYARPKDDKLKPYYDVIEKVCSNLGIKVDFVTLIE